MRLRDWAFAASLAAAPGVAQAVEFGAKVGGHGGLGPVHLHLEGDFHDGEFGAHGDVVIGGEVCNRYLGERESCFELGAGAGFHLHDVEVEPAFVLGLGFGGRARFEFEVGKHEMEIAAQFGKRIKLLLEMKIDTERGEASYGGGLEFCSEGETCGSVEVVEGHDGETMAVLGLSLAIGGHDHHGHEAHKGHGGHRDDEPVAEKHSHGGHVHREVADVRTDGCEGWVFGDGERGVVDDRWRLVFDQVRIVISDKVKVEAQNGRCLGEEKLTLRCGDNSMVIEVSHVVGAVAGGLYRRCGGASR